MKIAIIGSGGREHALAHQLSKSKKYLIYTVYLVMVAPINIYKYSIKF